MRLFPFFPQKFRKFGNLIMQAIRCSWGSLTTSGVRARVREVPRFLLSYFLPDRAKVRLAEAPAVRGCRRFFWARASVISADVAVLQLVARRNR